MRKKQVFCIVFGLSAMLLSACQKDDIIKPIDVETTTAAETTVEGTTEETSTEIPKEFVYIIPPEQFEYFTDGEPHDVLFYSDEEKTRWANFTSVSKPELGIKSVSFPSVYVEKDTSELRIIKDDTVMLNTEEDAKAIYDCSTYSWMDSNSYARWIPYAGKVGIIYVKSDFDSTERDPEVEDFDPAKYGYKLRPYNDSETPIVKQLTLSGSEVYCMPIKTYTGRDDMVYEGFAIFRYHGGMMEGVYYTFYAEDRPQDWLKYIMHSLVFAD